MSITRAVSDISGDDEGPWSQCNSSRIICVQYAYSIYGPNVQSHYAHDNDRLLEVQCGQLTGGEHDLVVLGLYSSSD